MRTAKRKATDRAYYKRNRVRIKFVASIHYAIHHEVIDARDQAWRDANKPRLKVYWAAYRLAKKATANTRAELKGTP